MRLVPDTPVTPQLWQVCFIGKDRRGPWDWVLPQNFRHVFLLGYMPENGLWLCYDVLFWKTEITILSNARAGNLLSLAQDAGGVLNVVPQPGSPSSWIRFGFWCVPGACHVLGLGCVALTPKGLHRYLLKNGATPLRETKP